MLALIALIGLVAGGLGAYRNYFARQQTAICRLAALLGERDFIGELNNVRPRNDLWMCNGLVHINLVPGAQLLHCLVVADNIFDVTGFELNDLGNEFQSALQSELPLDAIMHEVVQFRGINAIDIRSRRLNDRHVAEMAVLAVVCKVRIESDNITDESLKHIGQLTSLTELTVSSSSVTDIGVGYLAALPNLQKLRITSSSITGASLGKLKHLTSLSLRCPSLSSAGLGEVAKCKLLSTLEIRDTNISEAGAESIARLPVLQELQLGQAKIDDAGLRNIGASPSLAQLTLPTGAIFSPKGVAALGHLNLCMLSWCDVNVSDECLAEIAKFKTLRHLRIDCSSLDLDGVHILGQMSCLELLELVNGTFSHSDLTFVEQHLPHTAIRID